MPKNKKPRKKYNSNKAKVKYNPTVEHLHCSSEVRWCLPPSPHAAELFCLTHNKHIQWLPKVFAQQLESALKTAPTLGSNG